jgi:hypothetical protein
VKEHIESVRRPSVHLSVSTTARDEVDLDALAEGRLAPRAA